MADASEFKGKIRQKRAKDGTFRGGRRRGAGRPPGSKTATSPEDRLRLAELCRTLTPDCLSVLKEIMRDREVPAAARVSAVNAILDRGHGRPPQALEHTGKDGGPITISGGDLSSVEREQRLLAISLALQTQQESEETRH